MPNAAGDLLVDAGIAASDVICCVRLGVHSNSGTHSDAVTLLERADKGSETYLRAGRNCVIVHNGEAVSASGQSRSGSGAEGGLNG